MTDINERLTNTLDRLDTAIEMLEEYLKEKQKKEKKPTEDSSVIQFIDRMLEDEFIILTDGEFSRKIDLMKVSELYQQYFKFCRANNFVPLGVRNFQKIIVNHYSPNPLSISVIFSGYNRFEFLEYPKTETSEVQS